MITRYQTEEMSAIWSDENRFKQWYLVELAYLDSFLRFHQKEDAELMMRLKQHAKTIDWQKFAGRVEHFDGQVKHDVIAFLHALEEEIGSDARLIHVGLTSSDVVDSAFACQLVASCELLATGLQGLIKTFWQRAMDFKGVVCLGRTHGQSAEPTSFGLKLLSHMCEMVRGYDRLKNAAKDIGVGKLSGAVGVYAYSHPKIEARALNSLGLKCETISTQVVARDRHAHFFCTLATLGGSIERAATEIRLLMHGQVKEAFEPFAAGQKGSSAMPHKKNPVLSENLCGLMRLVRSYSLSAMENQALWHERDISHSSVERVIAPDATNLMDFAIKRLNGVVQKLVVNESQMRANLDTAGDILYSQGVLLALIDKGVMRQKAYEMVQRAALACSSKNSFRAGLMACGAQEHLSKSELENIFSAQNSLRHEEELFERARATFSF